MLLLLTSNAVKAQPTFIGTQLVDGSYQTYNLNDLGAFRQVRVQASNGAASGRLWEFATGNYFENWRPYSGGQTLAGYNQVVNPASEAASSCSLNMLTQPPSTSVRAQYCNGTVLSPSSNYILAEVVAGADLYQWRLTPLIGGLSTYEYTGGYSLYFGPQTDVQGGVTYDVAVRARVQGLWGDFENECPLTVQPNPGMEAPRDFSEAKWMEQGDLSIYPNPNGGEELMIILTGMEDEEGTVQLELLDMMGRLIQNERISSKGEQISYKMLFEERLPSGLYLLRASQEGMMLTRRLVIE